MVYVKTDPFEGEQLQAILNPEQWELFMQMQPGEKDHAVTLYRKLVEQGETQSDLLLAAPTILRVQLDRTRNAIAGACSVSSETIKYLRPPYGAFTAQTLSLLTDWGYRLVMWNSIPPHWMQPLPWTIKKVMQDIIPGSVIVLHDGHGHGAKVASIVDTIIPRLKSSGYNFIKVEEMERNRSNE